MSLQTVLGKIERKDFGIISPHEHILIDLGNFFQAHAVKGVADPAKEKVRMDNLGILKRDPYAFLDNLCLDDHELQTRELLYFKAAGGRMVVDATMPGIGRDPRALRQIARKTGLHVVMGTGFYVESSHPATLRDLSDEEIAAGMVREIEVGVEDTGIKAGFIGEIGISEWFSDSERCVLRAAALAQKHTNVSMHVHINPWTTHGLEAADILLQEGVAPNRINICHIDVENREDYIFRLLEKGLYIEFDNFGKEYFIDRDVRNSGYGCFVSDVARVRLIRKLVDAGHVRQLLLSCDVCLKTLLRSYGGWGYDHVLVNIVPMLQEEGLSDTQIHQLIVENPADFMDVSVSS